MDRRIIFEASDLRVRLTCKNCDTEFVLSPPNLMTGNKFDSCPQCYKDLLEPLRGSGVHPKERLNNLLFELGNLQDSDTFSVRLEVGWDPS